MPSEQEFKELKLQVAQMNELLTSLSVHMQTVLSGVKLDHPELFQDTVSFPNAPIPKPFPKPNANSGTSGSNDK